MESGSKSSNVEVRGDLILNNPLIGLASTKHVFLENTGTVNYTQNAVSTVGPWSEVVDVGDWFDSGTSTTNVVVPADVHFIDMFLNLNWQASATPPEQVQHARIRLNSGDLFTNGDVQGSHLWTNDPPYPNATVVHQINTHLVPVSEGDILTVEVELASDGVNNGIIQAGATAWLIVAWPFKEGA